MNIAELDDSYMSLLTIASSHTSVQNGNILYYYTILASHHIVSYHSAVSFYVRFLKCVQYKQYCSGRGRGSGVTATDAGVVHSVRCASALPQVPYGNTGGVELYYRNYLFSSHPIPPVPMPSHLTPSYLAPPPPLKPLHLTPFHPIWPQ